jgi:3-keto steroid reductase
VASALFPLHPILYYFYVLALYIARWLGSPWHPTTAYPGAKAPAWTVLEEQSRLESLHAERTKWGSSCSRFGVAVVKATEVEGWGWEGEGEDTNILSADTAVGVMRKVVGRKGTRVPTTRESREEFEALGAHCWKEMEQLRHEWEAILGVRSSQGKKKQKS